MPDYAEFRLRIERGVTSRSYRIVASGPSGEATGRLMLPFSDVELENFVLRLGRTRRGTRRVDSPEMALAKTFGTKLFDAVFEGDVRELYRSAATQANDLGQGLRVSLAMTGAPELLQVPWEYLFDRPNFLSISTWSPIVRYLELAKPPRPLQIALPLRILGMVSAPSDAEPIRVEEEKAKLEASLAALVKTGVVTIDWLETANLLALARQLRRADYHVFHYIGHGGFDAESKDGILLFEDEHGRSERVSGAQLGDILHDEKTLRLAVLNACEGARASVDDPFAGVATSLIEREIPAVIGMQFEITDRAAIVFASEFYSTLADGQPVDAAISEARKSIYAMGNDIEWGTPVLFMRVQDGRLFDIKPHEPVVRLDPIEVAAAAMAPVVEEGAVRSGNPGTAEVPRSAEVDDKPQAAAEAAERERLAAEVGDRDRLAAKAAERERLGAEAAEQERLAAEAAEQERAAAAEAAEQQRLAAMRDRLAAEAAERDRLAAERDRLEAERDRAAAADTEALRKRLAALEVEQAEQARRQREAEERAAREGAGAVNAPKPVPGPAPAPSTSSWVAPKQPRGFPIRAVVGIVIVLIVLGAAWSASADLLSTTPPPADTPFNQGTNVVPNVVFLTLDDALGALSAAGFTDVSFDRQTVACDSGWTSGQVMGVLDGSTGNALDIANQQVEVAFSQPLVVIKADVLPC